MNIYNIVYKVFDQDFAIKNLFTRVIRSTRKAQKESHAYIVNEVINDVKLMLQSAISSFFSFFL